MKRPYLKVEFLAPKEKTKMKTFLLKTKDGETINKVNSIDFDEAIIYFAKVKKLTKNKLLEIYQIVEE